MLVFSHTLNRVHGSRNTDLVQADTRRCEGVPCPHKNTWTVLFLGAEPSAGVVFMVLVMNVETCTHTCIYTHMHSHMHMYTQVSFGFSGLFSQGLARG